MTDIVSDIQSVLTVGADDGQGKGKNDMGVYIKNVEKPKECDDCPLCGYDERQSILFCRVDNEDIERELRDDCPLIDLDIVRCGECVWHKDNTCGYGSGLVNARDDDFCSYGERRTDEGAI